MMGNNDQQMFSVLTESFLFYNPIFFCSQRSIIRENMVGHMESEFSVSFRILMRQRHRKSAWQNQSSVPTFWESVLYDR